MSGLEGLGVALGVLPLLVSSIEHYEDVIRPFQRYKDFAPEVARFQRRLLAQKTIFRSQCQLLLIPLTDVETTESMINEKGNHYMWRSPELAESLKQNLGHSAEACIATMAEVEQQLKTTHEKTKDFLPCEMASKKSWKAQFRKRIKKLEFSVSENQIDKCITTLRDLNHDFSALSTQTTKLFAVSQTSTAETSSAPSCITLIRKFQRIGEASLRFCDALGEACSLHDEHQAHFKILHQSKIASDPRHGNGCIRFSVGLLSKVKENTGNYASTVWFESLLKSNQVPGKAISGCIIDSQPTKRLLQALKRSPSPSSSPVLSKKARMEKDRRSENPVPSRAGIDPFTPPSSLNPSPNYQESPGRQTALHNFCVAKDLCTTFFRLGKKTNFDEDTCLGLLGRNSDTHEIYMHNQDELSENPASLADLIRSMACKDPLERIPLFECISLARDISVIVLQFYATPLLRKSWNGDDILFYGKEALQSQGLSTSSNGTSFTREQLSKPHLKITVSSIETQSPTKLQPPLSLSSGFSEAPQNSPIRNPYLFRLGVILLEIAHQTPLLNIGQRMQQTHSTEFDIADYHSKSVGSLLGPRYAKVVRRCLGCDFGHDVDLHSEELRISVHKNVVLELENMISDFGKKLEIV